MEESQEMWCFECECLGVDCVCPDWHRHFPKGKQQRFTNKPNPKEKELIEKRYFEKHEEYIDFLVPNDRDWEGVENILESLQDGEMLNEKGKRFRNFIWNKHIKCEENK